MIILFLIMMLLGFGGLVFIGTAIEFDNQSIFKKDVQFIFYAGIICTIFFTLGAVLTIVNL